MQQMVEVARKLELTSIALGCLTRKELCNAFMRVNANTVLTLQNSYNWQSGRSTPRSFSLFEDWAQVLGIAEGPHFVMSSSLSDFARVLGERFDLPEALLAAFDHSPVLAVPPPIAPMAGEAGVWNADAMLAGSFLALAPSWSPLQRGRLLCGAMSFQTAGGTISLHYQENVAGRALVFAGTGASDGRSCQMTLRSEANGGLYLIAFHLPLLGILAGGVFAGNAFYDPNAEPNCSAILMVRNHRVPAAELAGLSDYLDYGPAELAPCLERLGYGRDRSFAAERMLLELMELGAGRLAFSMPRDRLGQAAVLLDRRRLAALSEAGAGEAGTGT